MSATAFHVPFPCVCRSVLRVHNRLTAFSQRRLKRRLVPNCAAVRYVATYLAESTRAVDKPHTIRGAKP